MTKITKDEILNALIPESFLKSIDKLNDDEKEELLSLSKLTDEQKVNFLKLSFKDIKMIIDEFMSKDKNHNHKLNPKEFNNVKVSEDHNKEAFKALDSDKSRTISFSEYVKTMLPE
jgi:hypothetical protein